MARLQIATLRLSPSTICSLLSSCMTPAASKTNIIDHTLDNGLRLLIEPMPSVKSAAFKWLLPAGSAGDPADCIGLSTMMEEFTARGAGDMSSREHSDALDRIGVSRSSNVGRNNFSISATCLGKNFAEALRLMNMVVQQPALAEQHLDAARSLCLQAIDSLPDDPQHLVMLKLGELHWPAPFNRNGYGQRDHLEAITLDHIRDGWKKRMVPTRSILAIAGNVDPSAVISQVEQLCDGWSGETSEPTATAAPTRGIAHIEEPTAQVHIAAAWDAPIERDADSMKERLATAVLSGGMSGRLFTEVRERRSLCYSVNASYRAGRDRGAVSLYAGTTPDRAQETLDVCIQEINRMQQGVSEQEFNRAVVGMKTRLVMHGESTSGRAAALASDVFRIGQTRTLEEVATAVDAISLDELNAYLANRKIDKMTVVALGPAALTVA